MYTLRGVKQRLSRQRQPYFCHFPGFDFAALINTLFSVSIYNCIRRVPPFPCYPSSGSGVSEDTGATCTGTDCSLCWLVISVCGPQPWTGRTIHICCSDMRELVGNGTWSGRKESLEILAIKVPLSLQCTYRYFAN